MSLMLFYGCIDQPGHRLLGADGSHQSYHRLDQLGPAALKSVDGGFLPRNAQHRTIYRSVLPGWTIIAMVDNTVDTRPGSNAEFLMPGEHTTAEMVEAAYEAFPVIAARLKLKEHTHG